MKIAVLSEPQFPFLIQIVNKLIDYQLNIEAIIIDKKHLKSRDNTCKNHTENQIKSKLFHHINAQIPFYFVKNHNSEDCMNLIKQLDIALLINGGTPRILKKKILNVTNGVINCHPGILPFFRGLDCPEWAIYQNKPIGNTVHFMSEGIDEGPIIAQNQIILNKSDNYVDMRVKIYEHGFDLLAKTTLDIVNTKITQNQLPKQKEGNYYSAIDEEKLKQVKRKLSNEQYKYQK